MRRGDVDDPMRTEMSKRTRWRHVLIAGTIGAVWLGIVSLGMAVLWDYGAAPGTPAAPPETWPQASAVPRSPERATVLMIAHPHCPCTRATLQELARLMARVGHRASAHVLFVAHESAPPDWTEGALWRDAARIPGVTVSSDRGGIETRRFGAATSGQVIAYDADGRLLFHGGITPQRGHEGDNTGRRALTAMLQQRPAAGTGTPVYGCDLFDPGTA